MGDINWMSTGKDAASGAAAGTAFLPGWGTAIGGIVGAGAGLLSGILSPSQDDIYQKLMDQYTNSPGYAAQQAALAQLKGQTVTGPTAQEQASLLQAYNGANQQFNSQYGAIRDRLSRTQGVNSSTSAALMASEGAGRDNQMAGMAVDAAGQEAARRDSAIKAYTQAQTQSLQIQDQYRMWASGQAYNQSTTQEAANQGDIAAVGSLAGSIGAYTGKPPPASGSGGGPLTNMQLPAGAQDLTSKDYSKSGAPMNFSTGYTPAGPNGPGGFGGLGSPPPGTGGFGGFTPNPLSMGVGSPANRTVIPNYAAWSENPRAAPYG